MHDVGMVTGYFGYCFQTKKKKRKKSEEEGWEELTATEN